MGKETSSVNVTIFEPEERNRQVIAAALRVEGMDGVRFIGDLSEAGEGVMIYICAPGEPPPEGKSLAAADIFMKPVRLGALIERVRRHQKNFSGIKSTGKTIKIATQILDVENNFLGTVRLTEKETAILTFLHENKNRTVARQELLDAVWGYAEGVETHTLETHIYRLRQKIEKDAANPKILLTEENGYRLSP